VRCDSCEAPARKHLDVWSLLTSGGFGRKTLVLYRRWSGAWTFGRDGSQSRRRITFDTAVWSEPNWRRTAMGF